MKRRDFLTGAAAIGAAALTRPREVQAQNKPTQIVVMTWGGQFGDSMANVVDPAFTKNTGIKVVQDRSAAPPQRITKLQLSLNDQNTDIVQIADGLVPLAIKRGVLEPIDPNAPQLTNLKDVYPHLITSHWIPMIFSTIGLVYNTKQVKNPPTSWADLWRPEFKGRLVLPEISNSVGTYIIVLGALASGKSPKDADTGFEMLKKLVDLQPIWQKETDSIMQTIASEEGLIAMLPKTEGYNAQDRGAPVAWVFPKEGAIQFASGTAIAKNTKNLDAALQWLNTTLEPQLQAQVTGRINYPGSNRKMLDHLTPKQQERSRYTDDELKRVVVLDQEFMGDVRAEWTDRWNRIVAR